MAFLDQIGFSSLTPGMAFTGFIGLVLIYLAIRKQYEPLLLLPIGFGILVANLPLTHLMEPGGGFCGGFITTASSGR